MQVNYILIRSNKMQ